MAGVGWPLPEWVSEDELLQKLFPNTKRGNIPKRPLTDWEKIRQELKKKGVTLNLLWFEYRDSHPYGYSYTQFANSTAGGLKTNSLLVASRIKVGKSALTARFFMLR
ncbi:MAG: transposase [Anaerolineales bacterium]|nr:transposase [Anaerolineales bacterium]